MKQNQISGVIVLVVSIFIGTYFQLRTWDGVIFISGSKIFDKNRHPAAIRPVFDFSQLDSSALAMRSQRRLIEDATFLKQNGNISIELGHFVTKGENNQKVFACDFYEHVDLVFKAEGVATGGEIPTMKIEAPCKVSADLNKISSISIPVERILNEKASDMDLRYEQSPTNFHFENMDGSWPKHWVLTSVHLFSESNPNGGVFVSPADLREINPRPIEIVW